MADVTNPSLPYPNSATSPSAPISVDRSPAIFQTTSPSTSVTDFVPTHTTSVSLLRKMYGPRFAPGHSDNDTLGEILGRSGVSTLEDYLNQE